MIWCDVVNESNKLQVNGNCGKITASTGALLSTKTRAIRIDFVSPRVPLSTHL